MNALQETSEVERIRQKPPKERTYREAMVLAHSPFGSASGCSVRHVVVSKETSESEAERSKA